MTEQLALFERNPEEREREIVSRRFRPRDYQERGIEEFFDKDEHALFRQPTGSGKTVSGSLIAGRWLSRSDHHRVIVIAHERQLIQQFAQEIREVLEIPASIEMADQQAFLGHRLIVASRATLISKGRLRRFDWQHPWLQIIDECHRWKRGLKSCQAIVEWFEQNPDSRRLGLTATPERGDKVSLESLFPHVCSDYRLYNLEGGPCAVDDGWAVPYDQRFVMVEAVNFTNLKTVANDFDAEELEHLLAAQETLAKLCDPTLELVGQRRTIIFNPTVKMARDVAHYINGRRPQAAASLDGSVPDKDRWRVYRAFQRDEFQFLSVCGLCREGYNDPGVQAIAIFRPTKSRSLAEQMKGRGCRPLRGLVDRLQTPDERKQAIAASNKPNCMIVDMVGITGLGDCATTAEILADGLPDEVIAMANQIALEQADEGTDMVEAVKTAQAKYDEQQREKQRLAREAAELREQVAAYRRNRLQTNTTYRDYRVNGSRYRRRAQGQRPTLVPATPKQAGYLRWIFKGQSVDVAKVSKAQASRIIGQHKKGMRPLDILRVNRLPRLQ